MTLALDDRQRAMLAQMGVRVFGACRADPAAPPATPAEIDSPAALVDASAAEPGDAPAAAERRHVPGIEPGGSPLAPALPGAIAVGTALLARCGPPDNDSLLHADWAALRQAVDNGRACGCGSGKPVFGSGDCPARWLIVGDPPDEHEETEGRPFVGPAGVLLDNMLKALGLERRHNVFLTNIMKCRLAGSRNPTAEELAACEPVLRRQVQLLQPKVILVMGRFAVPALLGTAEPIGKLRGRAHRYQGVPVVATYHPTYLLRTLPDKSKAWADLCLARELVRAQDA